MNRRTFLIGSTGLIATLGYAARSLAQDTDPVLTDIPDGAIFAKVMGHIDGEKFRASIDGVTENIRMIGVDAPEPTKPGSDPGECFAKESIAFLRKTIPLGSEVALVSDMEDKDDKDRLWRYVWVPSEDEPGRGVFLNARVISQGYALAQEEDVNTTFSAITTQSQEDAEKANRGMWSECGGGHIPLD